MKGTGCNARRLPITAEFTLHHCAFARHMDYRVIGACLHTESTRAAPIPIHMDDARGVIPDQRIERTHFLTCRLIALSTSLPEMLPLHSTRFFIKRDPFSYAADPDPRSQPVRFATGDDARHAPCAHLCCLHDSHLHRSFRRHRIATRLECWGFPFTNGVGFDVDSTLIDPRRSVPFRSGVYQAP